MAWHTRHRFLLADQSTEQHEIIVELDPADKRWFFNSIPYHSRALLDGRVVAEARYSIMNLGPQFDFEFAVPGNPPRKTVLRHQAGEARYDCLVDGEKIAPDAEDRRYEMEFEIASQRAVKWWYLPLAVICVIVMAIALLSLSGKLFSR